MVRVSTSLAAAAVLAVVAPCAAFAPSLSPIAASRTSALPLASCRKAVELGPSMQLNPRQPKVARRPFALRMSEEDKEEADSYDAYDSPLGSPLYGDSWETPDMVPVDSTPASYFVIGGILGCVPISILLIEGCFLSLGFVPDQCVGRM